MVLVRFPQEETGSKHQLSKPQHGPYRVIQNYLDVTVVPVHFPESGSIHKYISLECAVLLRGLQVSTGMVKNKVSCGAGG